MRRPPRPLALFLATRAPLAVAILYGGVAFQAEHLSLRDPGASPLLSALLGALGGSAAVGIALANLALLGALVLLDRLGRAVGEPPKAAARAVLYLALFPASWRLSLAAPDSLLLLLFVATLERAAHRDWALASVAAALAAWSAPGGWAAAPALLAEWARARSTPAPPPAGTALPVLLALAAALPALRVGLDPGLLDSLAALSDLDPARGRVPWPALAHLAALGTGAALAVLAGRRYGPGCGLLGFLVLLAPWPGPRSLAVDAPAFLALGALGSRSFLLDRALVGTFAVLLGMRAVMFTCGP